MERAKSLSELIVAERDRAWRLALGLIGDPEVAADAVQEACLSVLKSKAAAPTESPRAWFLKAVANTARTLQRRAEIRREREGRWAMEAERARGNASGSTQAAGRELAGEAARALAELDVKFRLPIQLHYQEGLSHAEVAAVLDMPKGTVDVYVQRGLARLRELLERRGVTAAPAVVLGGLSAAQLPAAPAGLAAAVDGLLAAQLAAASSAPAAAGSISAGIPKGGVAMKVVAGVLAAGALAGAAVVAPKLMNRGGAELPAAPAAVPAAPQTTRTTAPALIPRPARMEVLDGSFTLQQSTVVATEKGSAEIRAVGQYLAERLSPATGFRLEVREASGDAPASGTILLTTAGARAELGEEGYQLTVARDSVVLRAPKPGGIARGVQTIRQLLPAEIESPAKAAAAAWAMPCVRIEDQPRFRWRGYMLDVGRNFYDKEQIKRYIDLVAYHRMNVFHWHLTEGGGWRVEIRKHPRLTEVCGVLRSSPGKRHRFDGFYSQADVREIVAYAQSRHVMVVPEIDMPGHICVGRVYPELFCDGKGGGPLCPGNEKTLQFVEEVLSEVAELFPAPYIHIGADEVDRGPWKTCPKCQERMRKEGLKSDAELQSYFVKRVGKIIESKGRRMIAWNEAMEGGAPPGAIIETWCCPLRDAVGRKLEGIGTGGDFYFTNPVGPGSGSLRNVWAADLAPAAGWGRMPPEQARLVLGGEGCMWTDGWGGDTPVSQADSQTFPRLCGVAEALWTPAEAKGKWEDYVERYWVHAARLRLMGVVIGPSGCNELDARDGPVAAAVWTPAQVPAKLGSVEWDVSRLLTQPGCWEVRPVWDGKSKDGTDIASVSLLENDVEVARDEHAGSTGYDQRNSTYRIELKERKPGAAYKLRLRFQGRGGTDSAGTVWLGRLRAP